MKKCLNKWMAVFSLMFLADPVSAACTNYGAVDSYGGSYNAQSISGKVSKVSLSNQNFHYSYNLSSSNCTGGSVVIYFDDSDKGACKSMYINRFPVTMITNAQNATSYNCDSAKEQISTIKQMMMTNGTLKILSDGYGGIANLEIAN